MYTITRTGSGKQIAAAVRAIAQDRVPIVTAKALTFTAQRSQADIVAAMGTVFEGGATAYTRGGTRIETATPERLFARVAVKDRTSNNGTLPEDYLFPEVFGGARKVKRFERNLRYAGILGRNMHAVLGRDTPRSLITPQGNLRLGEMQRILTATRSSFDKYQNRTTSARSQRNARQAPYFVAGLPRGTFIGGEYVEAPGTIQAGVYRRVGINKDRKIVPVLIFTKRQPRYRRRLDFEGIARKTAQREFRAVFLRLLRKEVAR